MKATLIKFQRWQRDHPNFMTPDDEKLYLSKNRVIEVSSGSAMPKPLGKGTGHLIYGVSVIKRVGPSFKTTDSKAWNKMFYSKAKAISHANKLLRDFKKRD